MIHACIIIIGEILKRLQKFRILKTTFQNDFMIKGERCKILKGLTFFCYLKTKPKITAALTEFHCHNMNKATS